MKLSQFFGACKNHLTRISEKEPLAPFSLFLIFLFDILIFAIIVDGLDKTTQNIQEPAKYAGAQCFALIDTDRIVKDADRKAAFVKTLKAGYSDFSSYDYGYDSSYSPYSYGSNGYWDGCEKIRQAVVTVQNSDAFIRDMNEIDRLDSLISANSTEQGKLKSNYDTRLLEKIAGQPEGASILTGATASTASGTMTELLSTEKSLKSERENVVARILDLPQTQAVSNLVNTEKSRIRETYSKLVFWYPVKRFGMECLFLIPLFALAFFWIRSSIRRERDVQALVGSHVMAVLSLFALAKTIEFIYDILPKKLIADIIAFLENWRIIEVWYYLLVALAIGACLFAIYIVQKKVLNQRRSEIKRVNLGGCPRCGTRRIDGAAHCLACGTALTQPCPSCQKTTVAGAEFCMHCGKKLD